MTPLTSQVRSLVVIPACQALGLDTPAARSLVLATGAHETGFQFLAQYPTGPALGPFQMEPATTLDVRDRVRTRRPDIYALLNKLTVPDQDAVAQMATNWIYAAAMCRLKYWLDPQALPLADNIEGSLAITFGFTTRAGRRRRKSFWRINSGSSGDSRSRHCYLLRRADERSRALIHDTATDTTISEMDADQAEVLAEALRVAALIMRREQ